MYFKSTDKFLKYMFYITTIEVIDVSTSSKKPEDYGTEYLSAYN